MTRRLSVQAKVSTLALAAALVAGPSPAAAQFVGNINSSAGIDTVNSSNSNLIITGQQAVINWTATNPASGGEIVFLPDGDSATFTGASDFAVLNRVTPGTAGNAIYMGGNISSLVNGNTGGTVYFYSPNGIVIGQNAVINVGSLGLTTLPITDDGNGNWMTGFGGANPQVTFGQASDPNSFIRTNAAIDGSMRANGSGSYVALVAPRITHRGTILTDGTAALVAAEAATITFSPSGLFDIQVTVGTDAATGIHVDGGTIARNSATEGADHRAYLVAVAKNDAVTMLINNGGSLGFDTATSAQSGEDNVVVLSGGYAVQDGDQTTYNGVSEVPLTITNAAFSSNVDAKVTGGAAINSGEGALTFDGDLTVIGGARTTTGGNVLIDGMNGNPLTIGGDLMARGFRTNADGSDTGLITRLGAQDGSVVTVGGDVTLDSDSFGTRIGELEETGTDATGGNAQVNVGANSTLNVTGTVTVHADGYGGSSSGGGTSGNGTGGDALVMSIGGGAAVNIGGSVFASAQGFGGGVSSDCQSGCGVTGGIGTGGNASVHTNVGANLMQIAGDVSVTAAGTGGDGDIQAGSGIGKTATLSAADGSTLTIGADAEIDASGLGGYGFDTANGGLGRGGTALINTDTNGSIDLTGPVFVTASGLGGDGANGGTGTGGIANITAFRGTIHAFNDVTVAAFSDGGFVTTQGGTGGDGLADIETAITPEMTEASLISSGGTLTVDGLVVVSTNASGGDGGFDGGNGGNAVAGGVAGTINGGAVIHAANSDFGPSVINLANIIVTADAQGGRGANGQVGTNGTDGGNGGNATGGKAIVTAAAGSGDLTVTGATIISASATGGDGGDGGNGDGGSSGNGGDGGDASGGFINVGTESGNTNFAQAANNGQATFASIVAIADATGGNGGGFSSGSPSGTPGNGGDALGGSSVLLVRGSEVTVGTVFLDASATGGDGGLDPDDAPQGAGGDATTGGVGVLVTNRFQHVDQRGTLNAGSIVGTAIATGGQGSTAGDQWTQGGSLFQVINSEATIDSVSLVVTADGLHPSLPLFNNPIAIVNGTVSVAGGFLFQTPGSVSVYADDPTPLTATLTASSIDISAGNFIHDDDPGRPGPASVGVFAADGINLLTAQNLVLDAHLVSTGSLDLFAPGLIDIRDATSGGDLTLQAGDTISGGTQSAAGFVSVFAPGNITLGNVNAGSSIDVESSDGDISLAFLSAATTIDLDASGDISFADVTADDFDFIAGGAVTGGDIVAGTEASGEAGGAVALGNIDVGILQTGGASEQGFAVGISSATSISVGDVDADEAIGFATLGNLTTGDLNAGTDVMTLIGGNTTIASITTPGTGRTYHGDAQMFLDAGGPDDFSPGAVFGATPLRSGGSYTVTGAISTGRIQVGAASISTGAITAPISVDLDAANSIVTGNITGGNHIVLDADNGSIAVGNATASIFQARAGTGVTGVAIGASVIDVTAGGTATVGGAWTGTNTVQVISNDIDIGPSGSITTPNLFLVSTNGTQTVVGDGVGGGGYQLADAEYDRLHSGSINVIADSGLGAEPLMLIGDLTVDGSDSEAIHDYEFFTVDDEAGIIEGSIRVIGDAVFSNMGAGQSVGFTTGTFEVDAATGLLSLEQDPGVLGGQLFLNAAHIHVASGDILDQLADDPQYDGYQEDLNAPADVQRTEGVIRAASIDIEFGDAGPGELNTLYVQNTGTSETPAGFLVSDGVLFGEGNEVTPPPGSIDLIINGRIVTEGGTLTGIEVRDALVESEGDLSPFTANSTINGCALTGDCAGPGPGPGPGPFPPGSTPTPGIQDEVTLINDDAFPEPPFGNEDTIDDNDEDTDEGETSPIVPPDPLFDTSELGEAAGAEGPDVGTSMRSTPGLTNSGDVDDPVSGSGNPGLMEAPPPPTNEEKQQ